MTSESEVYVQLGPRRWQLGGEYLKLLEPCNQCLEADDVGLALRNQLNEKGYIYLKQILPEESVLKARRASTISFRIICNKKSLYFSHLVLEHIQHLLDIGVLQQPVFSSTYEEGILTNGCAVGCVPFMEGKNAITNHPAVLDVIENPRLYDLFTDIFHGIRPVSFDFKWLRGMHQGGNTGCHLDRVYMNRGSSKLLTCWIPLDHLPIDMGVLAVLEGSHRLDRSSENAYTKLQATYADMDVDRDRLHGTGWFTEDPAEFYQFNESDQSGNESSSPNPIWKTTGFSIADVL